MSAPTLDEMSDTDLTQRYPFIAAWGQQMGSNRGFILNQMRVAYVDGAPRTACFYTGNDDKAWRTLDDISRDEVVSRLLIIVGQIAARTYEARVQ